MTWLWSVASAVSLIVYDAQYDLNSGKTSAAPLEKAEGEHFDFGYGEGRKVSLDRSIASDASTSIEFCQALRGALQYGNDLGDCSVFNDLGDRIKTLASAADGQSLWVVPETRRFLWPSVAYGHKRSIQLKDKTVVLETMTYEPKLFRVHNFLSDEEIDKLVNFSLSKNMSRSTGGLQKPAVGGDNRGEVTDRRTSTNTWDTDSKTAVTIKKRIFELLRFARYEEPLADGLQLVHYDAGQFYHSHQDWFSVEDSTTFNFDPHKGGSNRFATLFIYLKGTEMGGETMFPRAITQEGWQPNVRGSEAEFESLVEEVFTSEQALEKQMARDCRQKLAVPPVRGDAILFYHQDVLGRLDVHAEHGACPALRGTKLGANLWVWNSPMWELEQTEVNLLQRRAEIKNALGRRADLYWVDTADDFVFLQSLTPGETHPTNTWVGHRFTAFVDGSMVSSLIIGDQQELQKFALSPELNQIPHLAHQTPPNRPHEDL